MSHYPAIRILHNLILIASLGGDWSTKSRYAEKI